MKVKKRGIIFRTTIICLSPLIVWLTPKISQRTGPLGGGIVAIVYLGLFCESLSTIIKTRADVEKFQNAEKNNLSPRDLEWWRALQLMNDSERYQAAVDVNSNFISSERVYLELEQHEN